MSAVAPIHARNLGGATVAEREVASYQALSALMGGLRKEADVHWRQRARCKDADPAMFFPPTSNASGRLIRRARKLCAACPVKRECLGFALEHNLFGVWAGTTEAQRREARAVPLHARMDWLLGIARWETTLGRYAVVPPAGWVKV